MIGTKQKMTVGRLHILLAVAVAALTLTGCNRREPGEKSAEPRIKTLLSSTDVVLVQHFYRTAGEIEPQSNGTFPGYVIIHPVWIYRADAPGSGEKGARIEVAESKVADERTDADDRTKASAWLDLDELSDLSSALAYYMDQKSPWRPGRYSEHVEVGFESKDQFSVSAFHSSSDGTDSLAVEAHGVTAYLPFDDAADLKKTVDGAIALLKAK